MHHSFNQSFFSIVTNQIHSLLQTALPGCDIRKFNTFESDLTGIWFWEPGKSQPENIPSDFRKSTGPDKVKLLFVILPDETTQDLTHLWLNAGADGCLTPDQLDRRFLGHWITERLSLLEIQTVTSATIIRRNKHIRQQHIFLENIINLNPNIIFVKDNESRFVLANKAQAELYQTTTDDLIGKTDSFYCVNRNEAALFLKKDREVLEKMTSVFIPEQAFTHPKTGKVIWFETVKVPITDFQGQTFILGVAVDITARKLNVMHLEKARKIAVDADLLKTQFLANMSHEIRTPLTTILGFTELLRDQSNDPVTAQYLGYIDNSGHNLLSLINDILDLSKIEAGRMDLKYSFFSLRHHLKEIENLFIAKCRSKGLTFSTQIDGNVPDIIEMDEIRLRQILFNLAGNAVKFTDSGEVAISVTVEKSQNNRRKVESKPGKTDLVFTVRDTGIGIHKEIQSTIFKQFHQQNGKDNRKYQGIGLGLPITKRLTEMMNGVISVKSSPDKGSTFTVVFNNITVQSLNKETAPSSSNDFDHILQSSPIGVIGFGTAEFNRIKKTICIEGTDFWKAFGPDEAIDKLDSDYTELVIINARNPVIFYQTLLDKLKEDEIFLICLAVSSKGPDASWNEYPDTSEALLQLDNPDEATSHIRKVLFGKPQPGVNAQYHVLQPEKLAVYLKDEIIPQWRQIRNTLVINDIARFAVEVIRTGDSYGIRDFKFFGRKLKRETNRMDIEKIRHLIGQFDNLVQTVLQNMHNKTNH